MTAVTRRLIPSLAGLCALAAVCCAPQALADAHPFLASKDPGVISVTETAQGRSVSIHGSLMTPLDSAGVYTASGAEQSIANLGAQLRAIPALNTTAFSSQSDAEQAVAQMVGGNMQAFARSAKKALQSGALAGAAQLALTYSTPVTVQPPGGKTHKGWVDETCFVAPSGHWSCLGASYGAKTSYTVFAIYSQGAVAQGLPKSWIMPNAGKLQWALMQVQNSGDAVSQSLVPVQGQIWHTVSFLKNNGRIGQYGRYDAFQVATVNGRSVLVNCAATSHGQCTKYQAGKTVLDPLGPKESGTVGYDPALPVDALGAQQIAPLEKYLGAREAVLLYGTTVQPVYKTSAAGQQTAITAVDIQTRVILSGKRYFFISPGGPAHYNESGVYGFLLDEKVSEFRVDNKGKPTYVTSFDRHQVSPTQNFSKSVLLKRGETISQPTVINPFPSGRQLYSYLHDTVNGLPVSDYVYVAPITFR